MNSIKSFKLSKTRKTSKTRVIIFLHDRNNLLETKNGLTFQVSLRSSTCKPPDWQATSMDGGQQKQNTLKHNWQEIQNTVTMTACLTELIHSYASIRASEPIKWHIMALRWEITKDQRSWRRMFETILIFLYFAFCLIWPLWQGCAEAEVLLQKSVCVLSHGFDSLKGSGCIIQVKVFLTRFPQTAGVLHTTKR